MLVFTESLQESISTHSEPLHALAPKASNFSILIPPVERRWEYQVYQDDNEVQDILEEYEDVGELHYLVRLQSGREFEVSGRLTAFATPTVKSGLVCFVFCLDAKAPPRRRHHSLRFLIYQGAKLLSTRSILRYRMRGLAPHQALAHQAIWCLFGPSA